MIFVSSYFYSLGHYDKSKSLINELNENEGTSLLIKARTDTLKENNLDFSYYSKIKITGEELGILNSSDEIFNGVVIDDTLGDDEIMVTDYSLRLLRKNNLLSFSTYNECVGSDIHITYKKNNLLVTKNLKIKKISFY